MPQDPLIFHLTGRRQGNGLAAIAGLNLRPALLAPYRDLAALRHDFPVVLDKHLGGAEFVRSLSSVIDAVLKDVAPRGIEGERLRRHALQLENEIRRAVDSGAGGALTELWAIAAAQLGAREGETLEQVLGHAGGALRTEGEVLGCTREMPARLITHAWHAARHAKARRFHAELSRLVLKLSDILRAAFSHSQASRQPHHLQASVGGPHQDQFDFAALSRIVGKGVPRDELPPARHSRLVHTLGVLESQRFFAAPDDEGASDCFDFEFDNCAAAAQAWRERLAEATELLKAISIAELEVQGRYVEAEHELFFEAFDADALTAGDLARLPDYLVCIPPDRNDGPAAAHGGRHAIAMVRKRREGLAQTRGAVLLVHGFGQNRYTWHSSRRSFVNFLAWEGWDVFNVDLRGRGRSRQYGAHQDTSLDDYILEDIPACVASVLRISGHRRTFMIGHSMGGLITYGVAGSVARDYVQGVITLGSPYRFGRGSLFLRVAAPLFYGARFTGVFDMNPPVPVRLIGQHLRKRRRLWDNPFLPLPLRPWRPGSMEPEVLDETLNAAFERTRMAVALGIVRAGRESSLQSHDGLLDYGTAFELSRHPLLVVAGTYDALAPPASVSPVIALSRSNDKIYREFPHGHIDMVLGRDAPCTVWPLVRTWLAGRA